MSVLANRNLALLFCCQVIFVAGTVVLVTIGGIVGHDLAPSPALATLPVALMVVGTALATIPAALSMQAWGRRSGFLLGVGLAAGGAILADFSLRTESFLWFCSATACIGSSLGFSQHFRFAAAESVAAERVSFAVSFILVGSIIGAYAAPEIIEYSTNAGADTPYALVFRVILAGYAIAALLFLFLKRTTSDDVAADTPPRPLGALVRQPVFIVAALAGIVGQGVMTYIMTATPISMNIAEGFSILATSEVIRAHVVAMYLPSLVTPFLIVRFGLTTMMGAGILITAATLVIGLQGHHLLHYWWSLVLLGVGWNFLFVSGTTLLTQTYHPSERFKAQAVNDFGVFGTSAAASLLAGTVLHSFGWSALLLSVVPILGLMVLSLFWLRARQSGAPAATNV